MNCTTDFGKFETNGNEFYKLININFVKSTYICDIVVTFALAYNLTKIVDLIGIHR